MRVGRKWILMRQLHSGAASSLASRTYFRRGWCMLNGRYTGGKAPRKCVDCKFALSHVKNDGEADCEPSPRPQLRAKGPTPALACPQGSAYFCFVGLRWQCHCARAPGWFVCSDCTNRCCQTQTSCKSHSVPWQIKHYHPLHANHKWECIISGWFVALIGCSRAKRFQDVSEHKAAALVIFQQVDWKRLPLSDETSGSRKWLWIF